MWGVWRGLRRRACRLPSDQPRVWMELCWGLLRDERRVTKRGQHLVVGSSRSLTPFWNDTRICCSVGYGAHQCSAEAASSRVVCALQQHTSTAGSCVLPCREGVLSWAVLG